MYWTERLGFDTRSLALFRFFLGVSVVESACSHLRDLQAHLTDFGVLPQQYWVQVLARAPGEWSIHSLGGGGAWWPALLLFIQIILGLCLALGWRTRTAALFSWVLILSLQTRNELILQGGDLLLRLMLFWAIFLPLGSRYSLDRARDEGKTEVPLNILNLSVLLYTAQIFIMYLAAADLKSSFEWQVEGSAIYYALHIDPFVTSLGKILREYYPLTQFLSIITFYLELCIPFLFWIPLQSIRLFATLSLMLMHLSFGIFLDVWPFPFRSFIALIPFLPASFWLLLRERPRLQKIYWDAECGFCRKAIALLKAFTGQEGISQQAAQEDPEVEALMKKENSWVVKDSQGRLLTRAKALRAFFAGSSLTAWLAFLMGQKDIFRSFEVSYCWVASHRKFFSSLVRWMSWKNLKVQIPWWQQSFGAVAMILVIWWNLGNANIVEAAPKPIRYATRLLRLDQWWNMFAPFPIKTDVWFVVVAQLENAQMIDARTNRPVSWEKPKSASEFYPTEHWRKYWMNMAEDANKIYRPLAAEYLCRSWNSSHAEGEKMLSLEIFYLREPTPVPGSSALGEEPKPISLIQAPCP